MIKVGIFGARRGATLIEAIINSGAEVAAICDYDQKRIDEAVTNYPQIKDAYFCKDFDDLIKQDIDVVFIMNLFHKHAEFAVKAMKAKKHVFSEILANATMAEGVELVKAVEQTGMIYAMAENYAFFKTNLEMKRIYEKGEIGRVVVAEGEYVHPIGSEELNQLSPGELHWRNWLPSTYYCTHSLAPLMYITSLKPVKVTAQTCFTPEIAEGTASRNPDCTAVMLCKMDNDAVFRVTGWARHYCVGDWYHFGGTKGEIENNRYEDGYVVLNKKSYEAKWEELGEMAENDGHGGGDFFAVHDFIKAVENGTKPAFDVYDATAMSSVGILGWRSILNGGTTYDIPDFRKKEDREKYENDHLTPFPDENGKATLPCCSHPDYSPTEDDIINATRRWKEDGYFQYKVN